MSHLPLIIYLFVFGACIGSFLNVVVWRLPRGESLVTPPSRCPKCGTRLSWRDNIPVLGWILLRGKCRYCKTPISARYPIIEALTGGLFVFYYVMYFMVWGPHGAGIITNDLFAFWSSKHFAVLHPLPYDIQVDWAVYLMTLFAVCSLLAASLIDAELFIIPLEIPWLMALVAIPFNAIFSNRTAAYAVRCQSPITAAMAAGGAVGLLVSIVLLWRKIMPTSFPEGEPLLEIDRAQILKEIEQARKEGRTLSEEETRVPPPYTRVQVYAEMRKEMLFLMPPLVMGGLFVLASQRIAPLKDWWLVVSHLPWVAALLGSVLGALVGAFVVWMTRILGTLAFGRVAMGLGDVHLMLGVGAVIGAGAVTISFFLAPFFGILLAIYMLLAGKSRELPYGPYLSLASGVVMVCYRPIADHLAPGLNAMAEAVHAMLVAGFL